MQVKQTQSRFSKVKLTYLLLALAALSLGSTYGYHLFTLYRAAQRDQPQLQADRLIRDLRRYERQMQRFPANFHEINQALWHTQPTPGRNQVASRDTIPTPVHPPAGLPVALFR